MKITVNIAVDEKVINQLKDEALEEGTSLNKKINKILSEHVKFGKYAKEMSIIVPKASFIHICENIDEKVLFEAWDIAYNNAIEFILHQKEAVKDLQTMSDFIKDIILSTNSANKFAIDHHDDKFTFLINHEYGINWSRCLEYTIKKTTVLFFPNKIKSEISKNILIVEFFKQDG